MNKSCNLIYIAGLILINCSNAADGYKPSPDPVYKAHQRQITALSHFYSKCGRGRHRKQNLRRTSPTFAPFHNWHGWKPAPHLAASFPLL